MNSKQLDSIPLTNPVSLTNDLTLFPRIKLLLSIYRSDTSVSPLDEWKLKNSLIDFLKSSFSYPINLPEEDLHICRFKDLNKRKREDPIALCSIFIRNLGFVVSSVKQFKSLDNNEDELLEKKFLEWRTVLVEKMDGLEVNLEGVKFRVCVSLPVFDDFELMKKNWEEFYAFGSGNYSRGTKKEPDTIILRGLPSRWFAEPRVSSKPSMLVTHTIFSTFGKIRNLNVAEDDDLGKDTNADNEDLISGLQCKVVVQFEQYKEFYNAMKVLCSRSLQKEGSRMKADYEVTWDKDGYFQSSRRHTQDSRHDGPRRRSYSSRHSPAPENVRSKRYKE